jgi:hypothetical protein
MGVVSLSNRGVRLHRSTMLQRATGTTARSVYGPYAPRVRIA